MVPPRVVRLRVYVGRGPIGVGIVAERTAGDGRCPHGIAIVVQRATVVTGEVDLFPLSPVVVAVRIKSLGHLIIDGCRVQIVDLADMVEIEVNLVDGETGGRQRDGSRGGLRVTACRIHRRAVRIGRRFVKFVRRCPVRIGNTGTHHTPVSYRGAVLRGAGRVERDGVAIEILKVDGQRVHRLRQQEQRSHHCHQNE